MQDPGGAHTQDMAGEGLRLRWCCLLLECLYGAVLCAVLLYVAVCDNVYDKASCHHGHWNQSIGTDLASRCQHLCCT